MSRDGEKFQDLMAAHSRKQLWTLKMGNACIFLFFFGCNADGWENGQVFILCNQPEVPVHFR